MNGALSIGWEHSTLSTFGRGIVYSLYQFAIGYNSPEYVHRS